MKSFLIFIVGVVMLAQSTTGVLPLIACGLVAWSYYRCGKDDGFKAGKEYLLKGKK